MATIATRASAITQIQGKPLVVVSVCVAPGRVVCVVVVVEVEVVCELVPLVAGVALLPALELFWAETDAASGRIRLSARINILVALAKLKVFIKNLLLWFSGFTV
jgi:hypothetical protein